MTSSSSIRHSAEYFNALERTRDEGRVEGRHEARVSDERYALVCDAYVKRCAPVLVRCERLAWAFLGVASAWVLVWLVHEVRR
jgi:hypothetical protein